MQYNIRNTPIPDVILIHKSGTCNITYEIVWTGTEWRMAH